MKERVACKRGLWVCGLLAVFAVIALGAPSAQGAITEIIDATGDGGGNFLNQPDGIAVDGSGNVYVIGGSNAFKITPGGVITEIIDATGDGGGNTLNNTNGIAVDSAGNVYITGGSSTNAFKIATPGTCSTGGTPCTITEIIDATGDGGGNTLDAPDGIGVDSAGNVYVSGFVSDNAFEIATPGTCSTGGTPCTITEIIDAAGDGGGNTLNEPGDIAVDGSGNVYVAGFSTSNVFKITPGGGITEIIDATGDGGGNVLSNPPGIAVDGAGNVYVTGGSVNDNAFKIDAPGTCSTGGTPCTITEIIDATGDGGGNILDGTLDIAVDGAGNVYVTGSGTDNAFKIIPGGVIAEIIDATGDGGGNILDEPQGIAVDCAGNVYVTGAITANAFKITPGGVSLFSTTGCAEDPNGAPTCTLGTLSAGASAVVTITVDANTAGLATNSARVSADGLDPNTANNTANETTLVSLELDLSVTKIDNIDPAFVGFPLTYTVTVTNNDTCFDATFVALTDTLPASVSLVSTFGCAEDPNGAPACSLGNLGAGASAVVTITVDANLAGLATNTASVSADQNDPNPANDTANEDTLIEELSTWFFVGTAQGGTIDFKVDGVSLQVITTAGQSAAQVATAIAAVINADPTLMAAGVGAFPDGNNVITNGTVTDTVITDPGITHGTPAAIPALSLWGVLLALLLITLGGAAGLSRRRSRRSASA